MLVLGHRGPNPRSDKGSWAERTLAEVLLARVTRGLYESGREVWPDKPYPFRVDLELVEEKEDCGAVELGENALECLRLSGCKQGAPVIEEGAQVVRRALAGSGAGIPSWSERELDTVLTTYARVEQGWLRDQKFGRSLLLTCDLCGRTFPKRLVRAAHVKRRADCNKTERLNLHNVMAACLMGCDELFEHGYVHIDESGHVTAGAAAAEHPDVLRAVEPLRGRRCTAFSTESKEFFRAHRDRFTVRV